MGYKTEEIQKDIYLLRGEGKGSHNYLVRASYRNVLIDSGLDQNFHFLQEQLLSLGLKVRDIDLVINTHEHLDQSVPIDIFRSLLSSPRIASQRPKSLWRTTTSPFIAPGIGMNCRSVSTSGWKTDPFLTSEAIRLKSSIRPDTRQALYASMSSKRKFFSQETPSLQVAPFLISPSRGA